MKSSINTDFNRFVASVLLAFAVFQTNAQVYPVQVTVVTTPPYYNYLTHYGDQNNHLQIIATFTDFASPPVNVRLRLTIEGAGFVVRTRQDIPVGQLYTLSPGVPVFIQGSDVLPYLTENSLELISGTVDLDNLPEGFTTVCVEVVNDGINAEVLSDKSCTAFFLQYMQPPQAFLPICSSTVDTTQLFQTFQWSPPQNYLPTVGSNLTYNFSLYEWIDTNNYNIFQTGQGLVYQTQTTFPMVQVSNFDVLWQTGRKYVWRVQAQLTSNGLPVQMFTQNGLSAPCSFYFGKPQSLAEQLTGGLTINVTAEALASRKGRALWTVTDETPGEGLSNYTSYIVEYRRKPYPEENYIYNWLYDTVYAQQQPIWRLEPEETYQVRVSGIAGDFVSEPSDIVEFTTPPLRDYACGEADLPYLSPNYTPLLSAAMGDVFQIGQFELEVTYIEPLGQVGHYRGRGVIKHDFIGGAKVKVKFDDLLVDNQFVVREGMATAVTSGVDEWLHDQYAQFVEPVYVPGVIDSVYVTDSTAFAVVNGQVLTFEFDPPDYPIILQDENGNQYTIYPGGTITVSTYLNVTDEFLGATAAMAVHFSENANDNYGFDKKQYMPWHANYEIIRLADSTNYFVANKSAVVGQTTVVNATINTQLFPVGTVEFKLGTTVLSSTVLNPQQGLIQVSIPSQSTTGELSVYAYSDNVSLGKLNLTVYDAKPLNVVVVPVASATIDETTLNTYLNDVFNDAGVNITATVETAFTTPEIGSTTTIQVSDATLMRKYSPQMRTLRDAYFEEHAKEDNTYYLFVVAGLTDSAGAQIDGYMVRGKQVGFIASGSSLVTYAHELGHGMGALQHSWLNNGPQQASTNNLMDYNDSTRLVKSQWEWLQDPPVLAGMWDEEEDEMMSTNYFSKPSNLSSVTQDLSASEVTPDDVFKYKNGLFFKFSADQLLLIDQIQINNGLVVSITSSNGTSYKGATTYFKFDSNIAQEFGVVLFYDESIPNRNYTKTIGGETFYLVKRDPTDIQINNIVNCETVNQYIYDYSNGQIKRRTAICPQPENSPNCNWTSNFQLNNAGSCAFRINRSSKECLRNIPASTKSLLVSVLADKIMDMSETTNQSAYNSIDFEDLGVEAPGWFPGVFNDGGAYDVGHAFAKIFSISAEDPQLRASLKDNLGANNFELLRKLLLEWNLYDVTFPVVQASAMLNNGKISSEQTTTVEIYGQSFSRSGLLDPYVIKSSQYNNSVECKEIGCRYNPTESHLEFQSNGKVTSTASFTEYYSFSIPKSEFYANGGEAYGLFTQNHVNSNAILEPVSILIGDQFFTGVSWGDYFLISVPRTYSYSGKELNPLDPLMFIFNENINGLNIEGGKPYIMPAIWGLCMERAISDQLEALEDRVFSDKLMSMGGIILAPFTGGASLGLTMLTVTTAEIDLAYLDIQQEQSLEEYHEDESFRNAWNTIYTTVQIVDGLVAAPSVINSIDNFFSAIRQAKYVEFSKSLVNNSFFQFIKTRVGQNSANVVLTSQHLMDDILVLGDDLQEVSSWINTSDNYYDVVIHGNNNGEFSVLLDGINQSYTPAQLATHLSNVPQGKTIRLLSCNNYQSTRELAQILGRDIVGSSGEMKLYNNGLIQAEDWYIARGNGTLNDFTPTSSGLSTTGMFKVLKGSGSGSSLKKVVLGSEDLSQFAVNFRKTLGVPNHRGNVAVFEYLDNSGNLIKKAFSTEIGNTTHAEQIAKSWFEANNIPKSSVKRIYSELEPCELGSQCKKMLNDDFKQAEKSFSYDYPGTDNAPQNIIDLRRQSLDQRSIDLTNLLR